jgi:hypothetical protein
MLIDDSTISILQSGFSILSGQAWSAYTLSTASLLS